VAAGTPDCGASGVDRGVDGELAEDLLMEPYEVYAVHYAHNANAKRSGAFIGGDPHDGPMPLDYFVWAIKGPDRAFVFDTGFDEPMGRKRGRQFLRSPSVGLEAVGVDPAQVKDVILSHMHYDHCGNYDLFPQARYHVQDIEMAYCTGRCMCHAGLRGPFEEDDVVAMVRKVYAGRVVFHDGVDELAPGLTLHHVGGHSKGLQVVRVWTRRGWMVLASDASHFYANMGEGRAFPIMHSHEATLEGYATMRRLASTPNAIIPGHDPLVLQRYPAAKPGLEGIAVRLDV
jgi:glyoxylase-like metal-dependent hydrolase (beta-lactamase superfamily II)